MDEKLKKSTLYHCVKDNWLYTQTVDSVMGLAPETQVDLSRYSVTIELCDSYCLGVGDYQVVQ